MRDTVQSYIDGARMMLALGTVEFYKFSRELYGGARRPPAGLALLARVERPLLHAVKLSLTHPSDGRRLTFDEALSAPPPATSTSPLGNSVAVCAARPVLRLPVGVKVPVAGSRTSGQSSFIPEV